MKKLLSIMLAVVLALGLATVGFAASAEDRIVKAIKPIDSYNSPDLYSISPGDKIIYPLTADMFSWSSGTTGATKGPVTRTQISRAGVRVVASGNNTSAIKNVSIKYQNASVTGNKLTAVVEVEFISPLVSTSSKDFDCNLFLQIKNRQPDSRIRMQGTMLNKSVSVDSRDDYVNLSGGKILDAKASIRNMDIDLGNGIALVTNVFSGQKYYGYSSTDITPDDDKVLSKYPSVSTVLKLQTVGLKKTGNYVDLTQYSGSYIYNAEGKYLGTGTGYVSYSTVYYLSDKDLGSSITTSSSGGSSKPDGGTSSSIITSSSSTGSSTSSGSFTGGTSGTSSGTTVSGTLVRSDVVDLTKAAAQKAKNSGSTTAVVSVRDKAAITADALKGMTATAKDYGVNAVLNADTVEGKSVVGRLTITTANASKLTTDTKLGTHLANDNAKRAKASFSKTFKNKIAVVSLDQNDTFGMPVAVAAKVNLSDMNKQNLYFYSYNRSTNKYYRIDKPSAWIDSNGYLRFNTTLAGDIIISDGALAK